MGLQARWNAVCAATIGTDQFWHIAVDHRAAHHALAPLISMHARGVVLDAGAGRLAWRALLAAQADSYLSTDYKRAHSDVSFECDLTKRIPLDEGSVDTVFCCSVLEHVEEPEAALREIARIMKPGGALILSVPFRYYVHGAPVDYFRFTRFGVELMARRVGLRVVSNTDSGGLAHELMHAVSMLVASVAGQRRFGIIISSGIAGLLWRLAHFIDSLDRSGRYAQNVNAVLRK